MAALSAADYQGMLRFVQVAGASDGSTLFSDEALTELRGLIPCDTVSYGAFDPDGRGWRRRPVWVGEPRAHATRSIQDAFHALRPQYPHPPQDPLSLLRWSDRLSRRALRRLDIYWGVGHPLGAEYELTMWLKDGSAVIGAFAFDRFRGDFSDRDVSVLEVLLPHLVQLGNRAVVRWRGEAFTLTHREREVLGLVARGKENREIALLLYISPGTVRKHLDNIYEKLEVPNRTAAVSRAYGFGTTAPESGASVEN